MLGRAVERWKGSVAEIRMEDLGKIYPDGTRAVGDVNLTIEDGAFSTLDLSTGQRKRLARRRSQTTRPSGVDIAPRPAEYPALRSF